MTADTSVNRTCRNTVVVLITGGKDSGDSTYTGQPQRRDDRELVPERHGQRHDQARADRRRRREAGCGGRGTAADDCHQQRRVLSEGHHRERGHVRDQPGGPARFRARGGLRRRQVQRVRAREPGHRECEPRGSVVEHPAARWSNTDITADVRRSAPAAAQQLHGHGRLLAAGVRWRRARVPDLHAGNRLDEADWLEVRRRTARGCGPISTAGRLWQAWLGPCRIPNTRNIYTYLPDGSGGGSVVAFSTANAASLATHLGRHGRDVA